MGSEPHMASQEERRAENESVFRAANENLERMAQQAGRPERAFICECNRADCLETVQLSTAEYRHARDQPHHFVLRPGHENAPDENVIEENDGFVIAEKTGSGEDVARRLA
jgi:hypothetical protein